MLKKTKAQEKMNGEPPGSQDRRRSAMSVLRSHCPAKGDVYHIVQEVLFTLDSQIAKQGLCTKDI